MLDAIASHQSEHQQTFSDLCKQALHQYLLSREPTQSVLLFMELQHQIAQLGVRVATLEDNSSIVSAFNQIEPQEIIAAKATPAKAMPNEQPKPGVELSKAIDDPVLSRLGPLLDDF